MGAKQQLDAFIAKFTPEVGALAHAVLAKMRRHVPGALELVYDNYNALVIGFGPTERASDAIFSIAVYPRWINLFFLQGVRLPDPDKRLKGNGKVVRYIVLHQADTLDEPQVFSLLQTALARETPLAPNQRHRLIIKSVSARQRPRRPTAQKK